MGFFKLLKFQVVGMRNSDLDEGEERERDRDPFFDLGRGVFLIVD